MNSNQRTSSKAKAFALLIILSVCTIFLSAYSLAYAKTIFIVSDTSWKSTDSVADKGGCPASTTGPAWTTTGYNDSAWRNAFAPYLLSPGSPGPLPGSLWMWDFNGVPDTWFKGPNEAFFRRSVNIEAPIASATADFYVDDEMQVYINGVLAVEDISGGSGHIGPVDISSYLRIGENTLAIRAWDGKRCSVYDRLNEAISLVIKIETEEVATPVPDDTRPPTGAVHAYDNTLWPANNKLITVQLTGYVADELSILRDKEEFGVSSAYLNVNGTIYIIKDEETDLFRKNGTFEIPVEVKAEKGAIYNVDLYASDTEPQEEGGPNSGLVDSTYIRVPHDMGGASKEKR